jgi:2-haloacid dehalogenase
MIGRWATFDCYGTLIDWDSGLAGTLSRLWPREDPAHLVARYHAVEPLIQQGGALPYREVLARALAAVAAVEGLPLPDGERAALAEALPHWRPFPDVPPALAELGARGWGLAILSNTDPDLLAASREAIGAPVDLAVTAADAGSYKPAHGHWRRFAERSGVRAGRWVHVAASPFHDLVPAAELGLPPVWINRVGARTEAPRAAELPDLRGLADALEGLVPR